MASTLTIPRSHTILEVELTAGRKLGTKLKQVLWKDMNQDQQSGLNSVIAYVLFLRAERSYSAIRTLVRLRLVDDALALVRVMVEKIINGEYIFLANTDTALDYVQFHAFREWRDFEELHSLEPKLTQKYSAGFLKQMQDAHDRAKTRVLADGSKKSRFGRGHDWIDIGLQKRAEIIDDKLKARFSNRQFKSTQVLYHTTYKKGAVYLHGMFASVARSLRGDKGEDVPEEPGKVFVNFSVLINDQNAGVAVQAANAANLAAVALLLFIGTVFNKHEVSEWIKQFKPRYLEDLKNAKTSP